MRPILFEFGSFTIYTYGVLVATGVILGLWYARHQASRAGLNPDKVWNLGIYMILSALVLAKLWLVASDWSYFTAHPREIFSIATYQSGGTFYGGVLGAFLMIALYTYFQRMPILSTLDVYAGALPLGHAIGRLGCFAAGCCYGRPTSAPWGVTFNSQTAGLLAGTPLGIRLHPTQLYEAADEFLNFAVLVWLGRRRRFRGQIVGAYFVLYGIGRGTIEFFRGDPGRTMVFHDAASLMQLVSVALILTGAFLWWRGLRGGAPLTPAAIGGASTKRS